MRLWKKHSVKHSEEDIAELLSCVVSLYLYMARSARHRGREIAFIDHLLRNMFGSEIPLYQIEEARLSVLRVREAANLLNEMLSPADRIKIILNLVSLAYHERSKIHVLGSVEVVELADLLRLDVNLLDHIYDLFEGKSQSIVLPMELSSSQTGMLRNSMVWNSMPKALKANVNLHFLMIDNLLLVRNEASTPLGIRAPIQTRKLAGEEFHLISDDEHLVGPDWELNYSDIWQIYRELKSLNSLDDYLAQKRQSRHKAAIRDEYFIDARGNGVFVGLQKSSKSMLRVFRQESLWQIQILQECDCRINKQPLESAREFCQNSDVLNISGRNFILNRHWELIEIPLQIEELRVCDLRHRFKEGNTALKGISFTLTQGSLTAIMGPSGSGKTTLLQVLLGELKAEHAVIQIDGMDFAKHFSFFQPFIGYVPQDDLLFANLSVYENLWYKLKLCLPELKDPAEIRSRIDNLLKSVDLFDQRNMIVGDVMNKKLSGGQRRRLNIALELVMGPAILILDEPTSGLSSKDSESIVDLLAELRDQGKIIISTIHQPNACIYARFDNILLMDKGGVQIYFGAGGSAFDYFSEEQNMLADSALKQKRQLMMPEYFFDLIEYRGQGNARKFSPEYWDSKYRDYSFMKAMEPVSAPKEATKRDMQERRGLLLSVRNLGLLIKRNFLNKRRSKLNLIMTLLVSPLLAFLTAFVLRSVGEGMDYNYYENQNAMLFDFIAIIIFIFIGLANSIDDILSEKRIIKREMKMRVGAFCQLSSKHLVLFLMTGVQAALFYLFAMLILNMRGFFWPKFSFYLLAGMCGYSLGLLFSSLIRDRAAVINILPLVIIPQIMFSGAVIEFSRMNPGLRIDRAREIPEFCQLIPSRWLYEGIVIGSARHNSRLLHQNAHHRRYQKIKQSGQLSAALHMQMADDLNKYLDAHPPEHFSNKYSTLLVNTAQGRYSSTGRNTFMSYKSRFGNSEFETIWLDLIASLLIIALAALITLIRMRYYF
jgi:ABC-type multidrug transport system ATPase subunit